MDGLLADEQTFFFPIPVEGACGSKGVHIKIYVLGKFIIMGPTLSKTIGLNREEAVGSIWLGHFK